MINHLIFDTTDQITTEDTHSVGAYVRSGKSGALITHHSTVKPSAGTFGFVDGDVTPGTDTINETAHGLNTGDKIQLTTTGVLPAGLALATDYYVIRVDADNIKLAATAYDAEWGNAVDITAAAGGGTHTLTGEEQDARSLDVWMTNPSLAVTAVDLDIRDLTQADEVTVYQGTTPWVIGDGGGSITVDGTVAATQSGAWTVAATQSGAWTVGLSEDHNYGVVGANTLRTAAQIGNATGAADFGSGVTTAQTLRVTPATDTAFNVNDAALANTDIISKVNVLDAADTAEAAVTSALPLRKYLWIYNNDNTKVFIGNAGVTAANGYPLVAGASIELRAGAAISPFFVGQMNRTPEIRTLEAS